MRHSRRRRVVIRSVQVLGVALLLAVVPALAAMAASVSATNYRFTPSTVTVTAGQSVTWTNGTTDTPHTVTADGGSFDSGNLDPGLSYTHTFTTPGTFPYHCQYHQNLGMVGTVVVKAAATSPGPGTPQPTGSIAFTGPGGHTGAIAVLAVVLGLLGTLLLLAARWQAQKSSGEGSGGR